MTPLPHNPLIWVEDLPEDVISCEVYDKESLPVALIIYRKYPNVLFKPGIPEPHRLPPGTWKLICLGNQATEEEAREIVERYANGLYMCYTSPARSYRKPTASLRSLITANGWKNPVFLRKEK